MLASPGDALTSPARVLVLGGTGFLGSAIAKTYLGRGIRVTRAARNVPSSGLENPSELLVGNVSDGSFLARAMVEVDHVVYAIGTRFPADSNLDPAADAAETLPGLIRLLEALRSRPGVGLTFLSSGGTVYGDQQQTYCSESAACEPITSYGVMKLAAEKYVGMYAKLYGVPACVARVSNGYGPGQQAGRGQGAVAAFLHAARIGRPVTLFGDGLVVRDYVHADDVAQAVVDLTSLPSAPTIVNVGSGVGHTLVEVLDVVQEVTGRPLEIERRDARSFDVRAVVLDTTRLQRAINWSPRDLRAGVSQTWEQRREK